MSENNQAQGIYGYANDDVPQQGPSLSFGLNQNKIFLDTFQWIPNGGKDGAELEVLDIQFRLEGREKTISYRKFPVTRGYKEGQPSEAIEDVREAANEQNASIMHILGCFVPKDVIAEAFKVPISSFKEFCKICEGLLPENFKSVPLDAFAQYQYTISANNDRTYLEFPRNMKQGKWLVPATTIAWVEEKSPKGLRYVDPANPENIHPFQRGEYFMGTTWANQTKEGGSTGGATHNTASAGSPGAW